MMKVRAVILQLLVGALGAVLVLVAKSWLYPIPQLAALDSERLLQMQLNRWSSTELSDAELQEQADAFGRSFTQVLNELYQQDRLILLSPAAVLSPMPDATDLVIERMQLEAP